MATIIKKILGAILASAVLGCAATPVVVAPPGAMPLYFDEETMRAEVAKHVPVGTLAADAQRIMQDHGFRCRIEEKSVTSPTDIKTPTYISCSRVKPPANPAHQGIVLDEIFVWMPIEAGRVQSIMVRHINTSM